MTGERRKGLGGFFHHQGRSIEETGKALASLLPKEFRAHAQNAVDEARTSWQALFDGVADTMQAGLDRVRSAPKPDDSKEKVEVD